jgi:Holliday junction resolvase RusA-like endonuclease
MTEVKLLQVPVSLNRWQSMHWRPRQELKEQWLWELHSLLRDVPRNNSHVNLSAEIWFSTNRRRDVDNFASVLWKMTQDALVELGIIPDDTSKYVTTGLVDLRVDRDSMEHTVLRIEVTP